MRSPRRLRLALLPVLLLGSTSKATAGALPELGRETSIRSVGSAAVTVRLPEDSRFKFAASGQYSAPLESEGGRFAGVLVQELRSDTRDGMGNQFMLVHLLPPLDCSPTRCVKHEYRWWSMYLPPGEDPPDRYIDLPAGLYRIWILADGAAPTSARLRFTSASIPAVDLVAEEPTGFQAAVVGEPTTIAGLEPIAQGADDGILEGFGRAYVFAWAVLGPGAVSLFNVCQGDPGDRSTFDEDGNCQPNIGLGQASGGGGATHYFSLWDGCTFAPCARRTIRQGFRWTHPPGYNQGVGAVLFWVPYV